MRRTLFRLRRAAVCLGMVGGCISAPARTHTDTVSRRTTTVYTARGGQLFMPPVSYDIQPRCSTLYMRPCTVRNLLRVLRRSEPVALDWRRCKAAWSLGTKSSASPCGSENADVRTWRRLRARITHSSSISLRSPSLKTHGDL